MFKMIIEIRVLIKLKILKYIEGNEVCTHNDHIYPVHDYFTIYVLVIFNFQKHKLKTLLTIFIPYCKCLSCNVSLLLCT